MYREISSEVVDEEGTGVDKDVAGTQPSYHCYSRGAEGAHAHIRFVPDMEGTRHRLDTGGVQTAGAVAVADVEGVAGTHVALQAVPVVDFLEVH